MTTDDYPLSRKYSKAQIDEVDDLYDEMPLRKVSEKTDILYGTLARWRHKGYIGTETNHYSTAARERSKYTNEDIQRADELYDRVRLSAVSDIMGIPLKTLVGWKSKEWISTDTNHRHAGRTPEKNRRRAHRVAHLVHRKGYLQKEVAEKMDLSEGMVSRLLKMYRQGVYCSTELE